MISSWMKFSQSLYLSPTNPNTITQTQKTSKMDESTMAQMQPHSRDPALLFICFLMLIRMFSKLWIY